MRLDPFRCAMPADYADDALEIYAAIMTAVSHLIVYVYLWHG